MPPVRISSDTAKPQRIAALQEVTAALVAAGTPEEVYAAIGTVVRTSAGGDGIAVLLTEDDQLMLRHHAGYDNTVVEHLRELPLSHLYPAGDVSVTGRARYLSTPAEFAAAQPDPDIAVSGGGRSAWAFLSLSTGGQLLGAVMIGYAQPQQFDDEQRPT